MVLLASLYTCSKQIDAFSFVADAAVEPLEVYCMLHGASFDEISIGNVVVIRSQAVGETKVGFGIWVDFGGTELDDVPKTFGGAMHA